MISVYITTQKSLRIFCLLNLLFWMSFPEIGLAQKSANKEKEEDFFGYKNWGDS